MKTLTAAATLLAASLLMTSCGASTKETEKEPSDETSVTSSQKESEAETEASSVASDTEATSASTEASASATYHVDESIELVPYEGDVDQGFIGTWNRTNVHSGHRATIDITSIGSDTFGGIEGTFLHFTGDFEYYANTGSIEGEALFISEDEAVYTYWDSLEDPNLCYDTYLFFYLDGEGLHVSLQGNNGMLGMGHNVYATGDYITGEPSYTNENILEETFTSEELEQISELLGEETYNDQFIYMTTAGGVMEEEGILADDTHARHIRAFIPGAGTGYDLIITEDGRIYYLATGDVFATNDADYDMTELPGFTAHPQPGVTARPQ